MTGTGEHEWDRCGHISWQTPVVGGSAKSPTILAAAFMPSVGTSAPENLATPSGTALNAFGDGARPI